MYSMMPHYAHLPPNVVVPVVLEKNLCPTGMTALDRAKATQREIEQQQMAREATLEQFRKNTQIRVANAAAAKREAVVLRNAALRDQVQTALLQLEAPETVTEITPLQVEVAKMEEGVQSASSALLAFADRAPLASLTADRNNNDDDDDDSYARRPSSSAGGAHRPKNFAGVQSKVLARLQNPQQWDEAAAAAKQQLAACPSDATRGPFWTRGAAAAQTFSRAEEAAVVDAVRRWKADEDRQRAHEAARSAAAAAEHVTATGVPRHLLEMPAHLAAIAAFDSYDAAAHRRRAPVSSSSSSSSSPSQVSASSARPRTAPATSKAAASKGNGKGKHGKNKENTLVVPSSGSAALDATTAALLQKRSSMVVVVEKTSSASASSSARAATAQKSSVSTSSPSTSSASSTSDTRLAPQTPAARHSTPAAASTAALSAMRATSTRRPATATAALSSAAKIPASSAAAVATPAHSTAEEASQSSQTRPKTAVPFSLAATAAQQTPVAAAAASRSSGGSALKSTMRTPQLSAAIAIAAAAAAGSSGTSSSHGAVRRGGHTPFERQTEAEALYAQLEQRWRAEQASLEADERAAGGSSGSGSGSGDGADGNGDGAYERAQTAKLAGQRRTHRRATLRFQSAIRHKLIDRLRALGVQMPPLCLCGLTVYAVDTSGCAQNCVFYKNPGAFQKAVEDIYQSMTA